MPFPPTNYSLGTYRIALREGFLSVAGYGSTNYQAVGLTQGGITINLNPDYANYEADQLHSAVDMIPTAVNGTIETRLAELSIWHLALALGLPKDAVQGSSVLQVHFSKLAAANNFHAVKVEALRPPTSGSDTPGLRTFVFPRVKITSPGEFYTMSRSDPTTVPITMNILGDWDEAEGDEKFFEITDDAEWTAIEFWS